MFESTLERDLLMQLDFDSRVESYDVQPVKIEWLDDAGKLRSYTPDVLVRYRHDDRVDHILYEVKYRSDIKENWSILKPKFKAAIRYAKQRGWRFKLMTEVEIRTTFLQNVKFLLPFLKRGPDQEADMLLIQEALKQHAEISVSELLAALCHNPWNQAALIPTLCNGLIISERKIAYNEPSRRENDDPTNNQKTQINLYPRSKARVRQTHG